MLQWNSIQCVDETFHLASISQVKTNIHNRIRKQHYCNCVFFLCLKCIQWDCMTWGEALMQYSPASMHSINQCLYAIKLLTSRWVQLFINMFPKDLFSSHSVSFLNGLLHYLSYIHINFSQNIKWLWNQKEEQLQKCCRMPECWDRVPCALRICNFHFGTSIWTKKKWWTIDVNSTS